MSYCCLKHFLYICILIALGGGSMGGTSQLRIKKVTYPLMAIDLRSVCIVVTMYDAIVADIPKLLADASAAPSFVRLQTCDKK